MKKVMQAIRQAGESATDPAVRNIIERLSKHLDGKAPSKGEPIVVLISTAIGGVVQTVDQNEGAFEIIALTAADDASEAERFAALFRGAGLSCDLGRRVPRPPKTRKGQKPVVSPQPPKGDIVYIIYLPG